MVGNKSDLFENRKVSIEEGEELGMFYYNLAKTYSIPFLETSAKETQNVEALFNMTIKAYIDSMSSNNKMNKKTCDVGRKNSVILDANKLIPPESVQDKYCCLKI